MKITVEIEGLAALDAALGEMKTSTAKNVLRRVGRQALEPFDAAWRGKVRRETGQLARSGGVGSKLTDSQRQAHERESFVEVFAGPGPLPQAITEEFGTVDQAPQGAVRAAWEETKGQVLDKVAGGLGTEIEKTRARAAKRAAKLAAKG